MAPLEKVGIHIAVKKWLELHWICFSHFAFFDFFLVNLCTALQQSFDLLIFCWRICETVVLAFSVLYWQLDLLSAEGEYQLWVKTAPDSSPANGGKVSIAVYGSQGHRKDIELFGPKKQDHPFEPGNIDEFEVSGYRWW